MNKPKWTDKHLSLIFISTLAAVLCFSFILGKDLFQLGSIMLDGSGDGFKNYFTFAYHLKFGESMHFKGMLYPYGDLVTYADAQPLFIGLMRILQFMGVNLDSHSLAIFNLIPLASFALGYYFIYKILIICKIPRQYAWIIAFFCLALSPQLSRIQSHSSLAHFFVFPAGWLLLLKSGKGKSTLVQAGFVIFAFLSGFIHPYYVPLLCFFALSLCLVHSAVDRTILWRYLILGIVPLIIFYAVLTAMDTATTRPVNPYGMNVYTTDFSNLFPFYGWMHYLFDPVFNMDDAWHEGYAYPGALLIIFPLIWLLTRSGLQSGILSPAEGIPNMGRNLTAGVLLLLMACGMHLWTGSWLVELIPPLQQFRSLGRFSWAFYYVFFVASAVWTYRYIDGFEKPKWKNILIGIVLVLWAVDFISYTGVIGQNINKYKSDNFLQNNRKIAEILDLQNLTSSDFQAVFALPVSSLGAEKITINEEWHIKQNAFPFSFQSGIPLTCSYMSRVPLNRILKILQMGGSEYLDKSVRLDMPENKPLLVVIPNVLVDSFSDLLALCDSIGMNAEISLFSMSPEKLKVQKTISPADLEEANLLPDSRERTLSAMNRDSFVFFQDFENFPHPTSLLSNGSLHVSDGFKSIEIFPDTAMNYPVLELSFWYHIQADETNTPSFIIKWKGRDGQDVLEESFRDWNFKRIEVYDSWVRIFRELKPPDTFYGLTFEAYGIELKLDKLLLKTPGIKVYQNVDAQGLIYYDHYIAQLGQ